MIFSGHKSSKRSHDVSSCFIDEHKQADNDDDKVNVNIFNFGIVAQNIMDYLKFLSHMCVVVIMRKRATKETRIFNNIESFYRLSWFIFLMQSKKVIQILMIFNQVFYLNS